MRGEKHGQAKLTEDKVTCIIDLVYRGKTQAEVAKMYQVATSTVNAIVKATNWKWVPRPKED